MTGLTVVLLLLFGYLTVLKTASVEPALYSVPPWQPPKPAFNSPGPLAQVKPALTPAQTRPPATPTPRPALADSVPSATPMPSTSATPARDYTAVNARIAQLYRDGFAAFQRNDVNAGWGKVQEILALIEQNGISIKIDACTPGEETVQQEVFTLAELARNAKIAAEENARIAAERQRGVRPWAPIPPSGGGFRLAPSPPPSVALQKTPPEASPVQQSQTNHTFTNSRISAQQYERLPLLNPANLTGACLGNNPQFAGQRFNQGFRGHRVRYQGMVVRKNSGERLLVFKGGGTVVALVPEGYDVQVSLRAGSHPAFDEIGLKSYVSLVGTLTDFIPGLVNNNSIRIGDAEIYQIQP